MRWPDASVKSAASHKIWTGKLCPRNRTRILRNTQLHLPGSCFFLMAGFVGVLLFSAWIAGSLFRDV